ncbi:MAG: hypothetical protein SFX72_10825 [Isosphaeraceae bacterium]|nr:hypothetical protein [Isosphaeraceae bacterium]
MNMPCRPWRARALIASMVIVIGCGDAQPPAPADPSIARSALLAALEAWKRGESAPVAREGAPSIRVSDEDWHFGSKLESFQIENREARRGASLELSVILSLRNPKGKRSTKRVTYEVLTDPEPIVIRQESN